MFGRLRFCFCLTHRPASSSPNEEKIMRKALNAQAKRLYYIKINKQKLTFVTLID